MRESLGQAVRRHLLGGRAPRQGDRCTRIVGNCLRAPAVHYDEPLAMVLTALLFCALGTAIASALSDMQGFQLIMNFLVMPLFFLSGALFPLPARGAMTTIARFNPLSYGEDALRGLLVNIVHFGLPLDFGVLAAVTLLFLLVGSFLFSRIQV